MLEEVGKKDAHAVHRRFLNLIRFGTWMVKLIQGVLYPARTILKAYSAPKYSKTASNSKNTPAIERGGSQTIIYLARFLPYHI